jgi:hypothetical protein
MFEIPAVASLRRRPHGMTSKIFFGIFDPNCGHDLLPRPEVRDFEGRPVGFDSRFGERAVSSWRVEEGAMRKLSLGSLGAMGARAPVPPIPRHSEPNNIAPVR